MYRLLGFRNGAKLDEIQDRHKDHVWIFYSTEPVDHLILDNMISAVFISTLLLILVFITIRYTVIVYCGIAPICLPELPV